MEGQVMTHPCDSCPHALPGRFCTYHDSPYNCKQLRTYARRIARDQLLERRLEYLAGMVHLKLAAKGNANGH